MLAHIYIQTQKSYIFNRWFAWHFKWACENRAFIPPNFVSRRNCHFSCVFFLSLSSFSLLYAFYKFSFEAMKNFRFFICLLFLDISDPFSFVRIALSFFHSQFCFLWIHALNQICSPFNNQAKCFPVWTNGKWNWIVSSGYNLFAICANKTYKWHSQRSCTHLNIYNVGLRWR